MIPNKTPVLVHFVMFGMSEWIQYERNGLKERSRSVKGDPSPDVAFARGNAEFSEWSEWGPLTFSAGTYGFCRKCDRMMLQRKHSSPDRIHWTCLACHSLIDEAYNDGDET